VKSIDHGAPVVHDELGKSVPIALHYGLQLSVSSPPNSFCFVGLGDGGREDREAENFGQVPQSLRFPG
jgi:hypothetical protein